MKKYQRRSESDWQTLITEQLQSGLSAPAFCKDQVISYASFISWKKKLAQPDSVSSLPATFVEITSSETDTPVSNIERQSPSVQPCLEVDIGSTLQLRIYSH